MVGEKRVGGNIGPQARQPLPGALHKKRREGEGQGISEAENWQISLSEKNQNRHEQIHCLLNTGSSGSKTTFML